LVASSGKALGLNLRFIAPVFLGLAIVFLSLAELAHLRREGDPRVARKAWLRIGIIFGLAAVYLYALPSFRW
jgi:hypothetical protein